MPEYVSKRGMERVAEIRISEWIQKNKLTAIMFALFFAGMAYGALVVGFGEEKMLDSLSFMTKGYMAGRAEQSIAVTFFHSFCSSGGFVLALFLLGFSAVSMPLVVLLPFFKGLGLGASMGYLYLTYRWSGIAFSAVLILPTAVFSAFAVILASRESFKLSRLFCATFLPRMQGSVSFRSVKLYCARFAVLFGISLISAVVDSILSFLCAGFMVLS